VVGVIHAVACLSLDGSGCLIGNADRQLGNTPVRAATCSAFAAVAAIC
jgi:hypothetical protein